MVRPNVPSEQSGPSRPNYNIQWGYNLHTLAKLQAVAYIIRANRRGRINMVGILPAAGGSLYGFIGKVSGDGLPATAVNGVQVVQYENDGTPDAGTTQITKDLGLGTVYDILLGDPSTSNGGVVVTGFEGNGTVALALPLTLMQAAGPSPGPWVGKDCAPVAAGDILAIVVVNPTTQSSGSFNAEIDASPYLAPVTVGGDPRPW